MVRTALIAHLPNNCELVRVATAATPLPTSADNTKPAAASNDRYGHPATDRQERHLAHADGSVADDEPTRSQLTDQCSNGRQAEIDPHPRRIGMKFQNDQRGEHRGQYPADRTASLLKKHRHDGNQHSGQVVRFLFWHLVPTERALGVVSLAMTDRCIVA